MIVLNQLKHLLLQQLLLQVSQIEFGIERNIFFYYTCLVPNILKEFIFTFEYTECYEEDTHYVGGDIKEPSKKHHLKNIKSAIECQTKCQENPHCLFFTWNSGKGGGRWNEKMKNTCWLKREKKEVKKDCGKNCKGRISGPKKCLM